MSQVSNPFTETKRHGGRWIGPTGAEPYYRGQELVNITSHDDYKELRKYVVFEEEGIRPSFAEALQQQEGQADDVEAGGEGTVAPLLPSGDRKKLDFANSFVERRRVTARDLEKMDKEDRTAYLQGLLTARGPQDQTEFLNKVAARAEELDIKPGSVEIRFEEVYVNTQYVHGFGNNVAAPMVQKANDRLEPKFRQAVKIPETELRNLHILRGVSGVLRPGRLTLLLGPPSSGKTALLKVLSGRLKDKKVNVSFQSLLYNNQLPSAPFHKDNEATLWLPHCTAYIDEEEEAFVSEMTVRETLYFAAQSQGVGGASGMLNEIARREDAAGMEPIPELEYWKESVTQRVGSGVNLAVEGKIALFGLEGVADMVVGNELLRGVTGAERKLLAVAESVAGPVRAVFIDNAASGLDSQAEVEYVTRLKQATKYLPLTTLVAMDQPSPTLFQLFDDVMLLSEGYIVYHGPTLDAVPFLQSQGFKYPADADPVDFLVQTTSRQYQQYWVASEREYIKPREIALAFADTPHGRSQTEVLTAGWEFADSSTHGGDRDLQPLPDRGHLRDLPGMFFTLLKREYYIIKRAPMRLATRFILTFVVALATAFTWFQTPARNLEKGYNFAGLLFFSMVRTFLSSYQEMTTFIRQLPAFFKHREAGTFFPWMYPLPYSLLVAGVVSFLDTTLWSVVVYFIAQMAGTFGHFIIYWFILWWTDWLGIITFRLCAVLGRNIVPAQYITMIICTGLFVLAGYIQHYDKIRGWYIWFFWFNPLSWIWRALMINEFTAGRWAYLYAAPWFKHEGPDDTPAYSMTTGQANLKFFFVQNDIWWIWVGGWAFVWGFIIIFNILLILALAMRRPRPKRPALPDNYESQLDFEEYANIKNPGRRAQAPAQEEQPEAIEGERSVEMSSLEKREESFEAPTEASIEAPLPFVPVTMTFKDVAYTVPKANTNPKEGLRSYLFKEVTGVFRPGTITAVMGDLGCGKKLLMDVLAGRADIPAAATHGEIHVNGYPPEETALQGVTGYVEQMDSLTPNSTVHEAVTFSARMRLSRDISLPEVQRHVEKVLQQCGLMEVRDARIGYAKEKGLSIEQRKRLHIAVELAANPSLVFLDEPTTRLEARDAAIVMSILRKAANESRTVVCTLQQPRLEVFLACDDLLLLKPGGRVIYFGAIGEGAQYLTEYFESIPGVPNITPEQNPAQWMLEVTSPQQEAQLDYEYHEIYQQSQLRRNTQEVVDENHIPQGNSQKLPASTRGFAINIIPQFAQLVKRNFLEALRDGRYNGVRFAYTFLLSLIFIAIFWNQMNKRQTHAGIVQIMGCMFAAVNFLGIFNALSVMNPTSLQRAAFFREHSGNFYSTAAFSTAQFVAELPWLLAQALIFVIIFYWPLSLYPDAGKFFWYIFFFFLTLSYFTFCGISFTNTFPTLPLAGALLTFLFSMWAITCGYFIPRPQLPGWSVWFYWINPVAWSLYGLVGTQLGNIQRAYTFALDGTTVTVSTFANHLFGFHYWQACALTTIVLIAYIFIFGLLNFIGLRQRPFRKQYRI